MKTCEKCHTEFDDRGEEERQLCDAHNAELCEEYFRLLESGIDPETGLPLSES